MKILVSGSTGFIGQHLVKRFTAQKHTVWAIVRPSSNVDFLRKEHIQRYVFNQDIDALISFMQKERFDGVIHLASLFLAGHKPSDVTGLINSNVLFATSLLEASVQSQTAWFINTGTFWQHYQNKRYSPVNLYAATKQAFEDIAQYYIETSPIHFVTLKLCDTFGPDDGRPKVLNLWAKTSQSGDSLDMSPGEQLIDISYIDNVIDGYAQMVSLLASSRGKELSGQSFAITSPERMNLRKLAQVFAEVTGRKLDIQWGKREYRPREVMVPWEKGRTIPGWQPKISIREGIRRTFNEQR